MDTATVDITPLMERFGLLARRIREKAARIYANVVIQHIREDTAAGIDDDGNPFPRWIDYHPDAFSKGNIPIYFDGVYSPESERFRRYGGLVTDYKDLNVTGQLMDDLHFKSTPWGDGMITQSTARSRMIARSQQFNPKWLYHHHFMGASTGAQQEAIQAVSQFIADEGSK